MHRYAGLLIVLLLSALPGSSAGQGKADKSVEPSAKSAAAESDPAATQLLADTRNAWARWDSFPGFTAELAVNLNGKFSRGHVKVSPEGTLEVDIRDPAAQSWADDILGSIVRHRLDVNFAKRTPCTFSGEDVTHPLGREVRVVGSPNTTYRIHDRQITVVKRQMQNVRFAITVLASHSNADNKILTDSYVVNTWDAKTNALRGSEAFHQTWQRVGKFDVPQTVTLITAKAENKQEVDTMELTNPRLSEALPDKPAN